jgi:hypothetical protein
MTTAKVLDSLVESGIGFNVLVLSMDGVRVNPKVDDCDFLEMSQSELMFNVVLNHNLGTDLDWDEDGVTFICDEAEIFAPYGSVEHYV